VPLSPKAGDISSQPRSDSKRMLVGKWMCALDEQKKRDDSVKSGAADFTKTMTGKWFYVSITL
jgi:hypothetical protein